MKKHSKRMSALLLFLVFSIFIMNAPQSMAFFDFFSKKTPAPEEQEQEPKIQSKWKELQDLLEINPSDINIEKIKALKTSLQIELDEKKATLVEEKELLLSEITDPTIQARFDAFIALYESKNQDLINKLDLALQNQTDVDSFKELNEEIKNTFASTETPSPKNTTPFRINENKNLTTMPLSQTMLNTLNPVEKAAPSLSRKLPTLGEAPSLRLLESEATILEELAIELNGSPVEIFNYVYNNISYTPYYGVKKGPYNTYLEKTGNDMDTALLLQTLLEFSGYETNLVQGQILLNPTQAQRLVGVDDVNTAAQHLLNTGIPVAMLVDSSSEPVYVLKEHTWLEVQLPYQSYRGTESGSADYEWIPLDASLKETFSSQELNAPDAMTFDVNTFFEEYLSGSVEGTPIEALQNEIDAFLPTSTYSYLDYDGVLTEKTRQTHTFEFLPNTLPYPIVEELSSGDSFATELVHTISTTVTDTSGSTLLSHSVNLEDLANKQVVLGFEAATTSDQAVIDSYGSIYQTPPYLIEVVPVLRVNGEVIAEGSAIGAAESLTFTMDFLAPRRELGETINEQTVESIDLSVHAGNDVAIAINTDTIVTPEIFPEAQETTEFWNDQKLYKTALNYLKRIEDNQNELGNIFGGTFTNEATRAFVFNGVNVTTVDGEPESFEWKGLRLDSSAVINYTSYFGDIDTHKKDFNMLFGLAASLDESNIFEDDFDVEAMSTVKALKMINLGLIPDVSVVEIDSTNESAIESLDVSESVKSTFRNSVDDGYTIYTPNQAFTYLEWTGLVYITLDPDSGDGGYTIGEGLNGGYTVEEWPSLSFAIQLADDIRASITAPYNGASVYRGDYIYFSVTYEADFNLGGFSWTHTWTEDGYLGAGLDEGTYYIRSGYGTDEVVYFNVVVDHTSFENNFITSLRFPYCDSLDNDFVTPFDFPCENGRVQASIDPASEYYEKNYDVDMIVIHYTAGGTVQGAYNHWVKTKTAGAHYIVDRDGSIYQIIDDEDETYHVAREAQAVNARSIGIEIVNQGYDRLSTIFFDSEEHEWNGHDEWQIYPEVQYQAVKELVQYLTEKHGLPEVVFRSEDGVYGPINFIDNVVSDEILVTPDINETADEIIWNFQGVVGHSALQGNKSDPGPLFDFFNLFD